MAIEPKTIAGGAVATVAATTLATETEAQGFDGFYVGVSAATFMGDAPSYNDPYTFEANGVAGAFFGYNHTLASGVVVGFEGNVTGPQRIQEFGSAFDDYTMNAMLEARARAGYVFNDMILAYGFAGVTSTSRTACCYGRTYSLYGYNAGVGGEYMLSDSFSVGGEITYRQLNSYSGWDFNQTDSVSVALRAAFRF